MYFVINKMYVFIIIHVSVCKTKNPPFLLFYQMNVFKAYNIFTIIFTCLEMYVELYVYNFATMFGILCIQLCLHHGRLSEIK